MLPLADNKAFAFRRELFTKRMIDKDPARRPPADEASIFFRSLTQEDLKAGEIRPDPAAFEALISGGYCTDVGQDGPSWLPAGSSTNCNVG